MTDPLVTPDLGIKSNGQWYHIKPDVLVSQVLFSGIGSIKHSTPFCFYGLPSFPPRLRPL